MLKIWHACFFGVHQFTQIASQDTFLYKLTGSFLGGSRSTLISVFARVTEAVGFFCQFVSFD